MNIGMGGDAVREHRPASLPFCILLYNCPNNLNFSTIQIKVRDREVRHDGHIRKTRRPFCLSMPVCDNRASSSARDSQTVSSMKDLQAGKHRCQRLIMFVVQI